MIKNILCILTIIIPIIIVSYMNQQDIEYCEQQIMVSKNECLKAMGF